MFEKRHLSLLGKNLIINPLVLNMYLISQLNKGVQCRNPTLSPLPYLPLLL